MKSKGTVFIIGSFVVACCVRVGRMPNPGETIRADHFFLEPGGKGFNCAVGLKRLGCAVDGIVAVGDDPFGNLARLAAERFALSNLLVTVDRQTGAGVGFIDQSGENCIAVFPGANDGLTLDHIAAAGGRLAASRIVLAQFEIGDVPILAAFQAADRDQVRILNPSPYRTIWPDIFRLTDILIVNKTEAECLGRDLGQEIGSFDRDAGLSLFQLVRGHGVRTLVITLGKNGAVAWDVDVGAIEQPAFPAEVVDTIGAGDAFLAGFAALLADGHSLQSSLRHGAACGALAVARYGLIEALPTRVALEKYLAES